MGKKLTQEEAISRMKELEPEYDFNKFKYNGDKGKSIIICDKGHEYEVEYRAFRNGQRCRLCRIEKSKKSEDEAISNMKQLEPSYDFSKFEYRNAHYKSTIICNNGHEYLSSYSIFISLNRRCPYCSGKAKLTQEEAISRMNLLESDYNFNEFIYINAITKSTIICNKGHKYEGRYADFMNGHRCPKCANHKSKPESEIIEFIKTFYDRTIEQSNRNIIKNHMTNRYMELDIYLPELNKAIEFNGSYYHTDERVKERGWNSVEEYHIMKTIYCKSKGIDLIHIFEDKWIDDKDKELSRIKDLICQ